MAQFCDEQTEYVHLLRVVDCNVRLVCEGDHSISLFAVDEAY